MVLVVGATLFVGTLVKLYAVERGFDGDWRAGVSTVRSTAPFPADRGARRRRPPSSIGFGHLPEVQSATAAQLLPISGNDWTRGDRVAG